ncbi:hypothetical protein [Paenibacillus gallinarum]|nr:hypothetical protein [Paenibacillus gallinarum]
MYTENKYFSKIMKITKHDEKTKVAAVLFVLNTASKKEEIRCTRRHFNYT